eukprot:9001223-Alexandrium_andersonii.AAC.1
MAWRPGDRMAKWAHLSGQAQPEPALADASNRSTRAHCGGRGLLRRMARQVPRCSEERGNGF